MGERKRVNTSERERNASERERSVANECTAWANECEEGTNKNEAWVNECEGNARGCSGVRAWSDIARAPRTAKTEENRVRIRLFSIATFLSLKMIPKFQRLRLPSSDLFKKRLACLAARKQFGRQNKVAYFFSPALDITVLSWGMDSASVGYLDTEV